jgi:hypothetical protein
VAVSKQDKTMNMGLFEMPYGWRGNWGVMAKLSLLLLLGFSLCGVAEAETTPQSVAADPTALVRRAAHNELGTGNGHPYRYKLRKVDDGKITTKEIVETKDGDVARLISTGDQPLSGDAEQAEIDRLNNLLAHPEIQEHRRKKEQEDSNRANEMIRVLPDAFLFHFEGMVDGPNGPCFRLSFKPNPNFTPPDREAEVYHGMTGELRIDQQQERMVRLDAHLIADVNFGWGILGKLFKGGTIVVEQKDVGTGHWETTHMALHLQGKILMIKSLNLQTTEDASDFEPVRPQMGYQEAVHLLLNTNLNAQGGQTQTAARN